MLNSIATLLCCIYLANKQTRDNINYNIVKYSRYYYQTLNIRTQYITMSKSAKKEYLRQYKIILELSILQTLTLALNIIFSRLDNFAYSKYVDIVRRIIFYLLKYIFQLKIVEIFVVRFRSFSLIFD